MYLTKTQLLTKAVHTPGPGAESRPLSLLSPFLLRKPGSGSNSPSSFHSCSEKKEGREEKSEWPGNHDLPPSDEDPTSRPPHSNKNSHQDNAKASSHTHRCKLLPAVRRKQQFSCRSGEECETPRSNLRHRECKVCSTENVTHGI